MNTNLELLPQCQAVLRIEVPPETVGHERSAITRAFMSKARIPGFRPGKVPEKIVTQKFSKDIHQELENRLVDQAFKESVQSEALKVIGITEVRDQAFHPDDSFSFAAEILLAPEFELPDYKGIPVQIPRTEVTDEQIDNALENLRRRYAEFEDITGRPLAMDDFAVIDFEGFLEDKPLGEFLPGNASHIARSKDYWVKMAEESFLPGFCNGLLDTSLGEHRSIEVTLPEDFPVSDLAGKLIRYEVDVKSVKQQKLPDLDDDLAARIEPGKTLENLRETIREQFIAEQERRNDELKTNQIVAFLDENLDFDLPADLVNSETQRQVNEIVQRSQMGGMEENDIRQHEQAIIQSASGQAKLNVKTNFILDEIAQKEGIAATEHEILQQVHQMATQYQMPVKKMIQQLRENNGLNRVANGIRISKTLDFLRANASVEEVDPPADESA